MSKPSPLVAPPAPAADASATPLTPKDASSDGPTPAEVAAAPIFFAFARSGDTWHPKALVFSSLGAMPDALRDHHFPGVPAAQIELDRSPPARWSIQHASSLCRAMESGSIAKLPVPDTEREALVRITHVPILPDDSLEVWQMMHEEPGAKE